jgi:hypothetical protein
MGTFAETAIADYRLLLTNIQIYIYIYIYCIFICCRFKWKTEAIFLNQFTVYSSYKRKFVVCLFVDKETTEVVRLQNGLNGLA